MDDKIIDRIRKLLALSQSPNENEAAVAAAKAQAMLAEHNLSLSDVAEEVADGDMCVTMEEGSKTYSHPWRRFIAEAIAELYFCKYAYTRKTSHKESAYDVHYFIGAVHNIAVVRLMFDYLVSTVDRLAKEGAKPLPKKRQSPYRTSFRNAATMRLCARIRERIEQAKSSGLEIGGHKLPALLSLYEKTKAAVDAFMSEQSESFAVARASIKTEGQGAIDGSKAADAIGLDSQVGTKKRAQISA